MLIQQINNKAALFPSSKCKENYKWHKGITTPLPSQLLDKDYNKN